MAKITDFKIFWFFYTLLIMFATILALLAFYRVDDSYKDEIISDLKRDLARCEYRNEFVLEHDSEIKKMIEDFGNDMETRCRDVLRGAR